MMQRTFMPMWKQAFRRTSKSILAGLTDLPENSSGPALHVYKSSQIICQGAKVFCHIAKKSAIITG
jgi:hypothetical protein